MKCHEKGKKGLTHRAHRTNEWREKKHDQIKFNVDLNVKSTNSISLTYTAKSIIEAKRKKMLFK